MHLQPNSEDTEQLFVAVFLSSELLSVMGVGKSLNLTNQSPELEASTFPEVSVLGDEATEMCYIPC